MNTDNNNNNSTVVNKRSSLPPKRLRTSQIRPQKEKTHSRPNYPKGKDHRYFGKKQDPLWSRRVALGNMKNCLETGARGFVMTGSGKFRVRLSVGRKRFTLGTFTSAHTAHRVYVFAVRERIEQLAKEVAFLEKYPLDQLRKLGKLPMKRPKDGIELLDQVDLMFTSGIAMRDYR